MTTLEKIKEEFITRYPKNYANELELGGRSCVFSLNEVLQIIDKYAEQEPTSPCDLCRFNPPSSADGKPCTMCPAEKS